MTPIGTNLEQAMSKHGHNTLRKRIIQRLFSAEFEFQPILLEEFRWRVFKEEMSARLKRAEIISRSYRNSFNRTVKNFCPNITTHQVRDPVYSLPAGLLSRAAVYRLRERGQLKYVPSGESLRFYFFHEMFWTRLSGRIWWLTCLVLKIQAKGTKEKATLGAYVSFPYTRKLVFVGTAAPTRVMMREIANVPWDIRLIINGERSICLSAERTLGPIDMKYELPRHSHIKLPEGVSIDRRDKDRLIVRQEEPI